MNVTYTLNRSWIVVLLVWAVVLPAVAQQYRAIDGRDNNIDHPDWGAAQTPLHYFTRISFSNSIGAPTGVNRPNPRTISNRLFSQLDLFNDPMHLSDYCWVFGQFIDHDLTLVVDGDEPAMIDVPMGDEWFDPMSSGHVKIPMMRSAFISGTGTAPDNPRQFANAITSFLDGSGVYGSDKIRADWLRTFSDGKLKVSSGNLLPYNTVDGEYDSEIDPTAPHMDNPIRLSEKLFVAGDVRANENILLAAFHTLFVREHNRLCDELIEKYPNWNDEQLYQYARKIVGGMIQAIIYEEWLPTMGIKLPPYEGYDPTVNPSVTNVFSAAAFRLGHTLLNGNLMRLDNEGNVIPQGNISLRDAYFNIQPIREHGIDPLLKGMGVQVQQGFDAKVVDDIRNFLFGPPGAGGLDLAAININRGRERGLPDYNTIREDIGLPRYSFFQQINPDPAIFTTLQNLYGNINNIDPWVGMLAEQRKENALFGPTVMRIMEMQFANIRNGDRYYYEQDTALLPQDRRMIKNTRMVDLVMRNTTITLMQPHIFRAMPHSEICPAVAVQGSIFTEHGQLVDGVTIALRDGQAATYETLTDESGRYEFSRVYACDNHTIVPTGNFNIRNGLSTLDLIALQKHVLNMAPLYSPYKLIAADTDRSGTISTLDVVNLRKVLLHISDEFPNNTAWRFVPADYQFPDPQNPFASPFPESVSTDTLSGNFNQNFIAIKVGDLNNSVELNQFLTTEGRTTEATLELTATDKHLAAGMTKRIALSIPGGVEGFQFALTYAVDKVELEGISANLPGWSTANFHQNEEHGTVTVSWNHPLGKVLDTHTENIIWLDIRARAKTIYASEVVQLQEDLFPAESYTEGLQTSPLTLNFIPEERSAPAHLIAVHQNFPNPFSEQTEIHVQLAQPGLARLTITDVLGRVLYSLEQEFQQGINKVTIHRAQLSAASGTLYYTLRIGNEIQTHQMILTP